jgi:hypothetical protein
MSKARGRIDLGLTTVVLGVLHGAARDDGASLVRSRQPQRETRGEPRDFVRDLDAMAEQQHRDAVTRECDVLE